VFRAPARAWGQPLAVLLLQLAMEPRTPLPVSHHGSAPCNGAHPTCAASPRRSGRRLLPPGRRRTRLGAHHARARGTGGAARRPHQGKTNTAADACPVAMGGRSGSLRPVAFAPPAALTRQKFWGGLRHLQGRMRPGRRRGLPVRGRARRLSPTALIGSPGYLPAAPRPNIGQGSAGRGAAKNRQAGARRKRTAGSAVHPACTKPQQPAPMAGHSRPPDIRVRIASRKESAGRHEPGRPARAGSARRVPPCIPRALSHGKQRSLTDTHGHSPPVPGSPRSPESKGSSEMSRQLPKLTVRVRFSSPAPRTPLCIKDVGCFVK
jgi:hypothetical protein